MITVDLSNDREPYGTASTPAGPQDRALAAAGAALGHFQELERRLEAARVLFGDAVYHAVWPVAAQAHDAMASARIHGAEAVAELERSLEHAAERLEQRTAERIEADALLEAALFDVLARERRRRPQRRLPEWAVEAVRRVERRAGWEAIPEPERRWLEDCGAFLALAARRSR